MKRRVGWCFLTAVGFSLVLLTCGCERLQPMKWVAPASIAGWWQTGWYEVEWEEGDTDCDAGDADCEVVNTRETIYIEQNGESIKLGELTEEEGHPNSTYYGEGTYRDGLVDVRSRTDNQRLFRFLSDDRMVGLWWWADSGELDDDPENYRDESDMFIRKGGPKDPFPR